MNCPHCNTHIDEHPASRCLDAWVAEAVMDYYCLDLSLNTEQKPLVPIDWERLDDAYWWGMDIYHLVSAYSTSIAAAWEVMEKLAPNIVFILWTGPAIAQTYEQGKDGDLISDGQADQMSHAICRAAIKAVQG